MLSRVAPWLASHKEGTATSGISVRVLGRADTKALTELAHQDPVTNVFILAHLEATGSAAVTSAGAGVFGIFDNATLIAACWCGANLVPVQLPPELTGMVAGAIHASGRRYASAFGPADTVLALYGHLERLGHQAHEVREDQPLMTINGPPLIEANALLATGRMADFNQILPACVAMFEEEVGYSPYLGGREFYNRRVEGLIRESHSLAHVTEAGDVIFKAELGAVTQCVTQVQGVWMNPAHRGLGLSAGYMAGVVRHAQAFAPITSLYVNSYNTRAKASYERVGFTTVNTFATVLF